MVDLFHHMRQALKEEWMWVKLFSGYVVFHLIILFRPEHNTIITA